MLAARRASLALLTALALVLGLSVPAGATTTTPTTATLTGTVTTAGGGNPWVTHGARVWVRVHGPFESTVVASSVLISTVDGRFTITGIPPGEHRIGFSPNGGGLLPEFSGDAFIFADAELISFAAGETVTVDATLDEAATITGSITGGGEPVSGATVTLFGGPPGYITSSFGRNVTYNAYYGTFSTGQLIPGDYVLQYQAMVNNWTASNDWAIQYSGGAWTREEAVPVTVGFGDTVDASIDLPPSSRISGTVSFTDGSDPALVTPYVFPEGTAGPIILGTRVTDPSGDFGIKGLRVESSYRYCVGASDARSGLPYAYERTCYGATPENPEGVLVPAPRGSLDGIDIEVQTESGILYHGLGRLDPATGEPGAIVNSTAIFWRFDPPTGQWQQAHTATYHALNSGPRVLATPIIEPGSYRIEVRAYGFDENTYRQYNGGALRFVDAPIIEVEPGRVTEIPREVLIETGRSYNRISGNDRFATAVEVSRWFFDDETIADYRPAVFIANGLNYPDALAAGPAAAEWGGPLLLVRTTEIPRVVADELRRLNPRSITIVGGASAVSTAVERQLQAFVDDPLAVTRLAGVDRYATSRAVVSEAFGASPGRIVFVATGRNYPDALAAGAAASAFGGAVVLVNGSRSTLDAPTLALLDQLDPAAIFLAGGPGAVSHGIWAQLDQRYVPDGVHVQRLSGSTRYETAYTINLLFGDTDSAFIASGEGFADALAGGPVSGLTGAPLYLTPARCLPWFVSADLDELLVRDVQVVGGTGVVHPAVLTGTPC